MQKRMVRRKIPGNHLHILVLGIIHKKSRINSQEHGQIAKQYGACPKDKALPPFFLFLLLPPGRSPISLTYRRSVTNLLFP